jgi:HNH endonuclease
MMAYHHEDLREENEISHDEICELFSYDEGGFLIWNTRPPEFYENPVHHKRWNDFHAGQRAGTINSFGYVKVKVFGKSRSVHRIIWFMKTGKWPEGQIDHVNGIKHDNRFENFRDVTGLENQRNRKFNKDNTSGFRGVYWNTRAKKWRAFIDTGTHLGYFDKFEDAVEARLNAEKDVGYHPNHGKVIPLIRRA